MTESTLAKRYTQLLSNKDLRENSVRKHNDNVKTFIVWLEQHPPFKGNTYLKNIVTGRVADVNINCHQAIEIG